MVPVKFSSSFSIKPPKIFRLILYQIIIITATKKIFLYNYVKKALCTLMQNAENSLKI